MNDPVNNPSHYNQNGIEVIDVIETYAKNDFRLANAIKYICRCEYKGRKLEDLRKAQWYLNRVVAEMEREVARELTELGAALYEDKSTPNVFVSTSPDRIAGDTELSKKIKAQYYDYDPGEVLYQCGNPSCREAIHTKDAAWSSEDVVGKFCSLVCLEMVRSTR